MHDVGLAGGDHLIGDLDKEGGHPFRSVVILGNTVDHSDGIHQARNMFHHCCLQKSTSIHIHYFKERERVKKLYNFFLYF